MQKPGNALIGQAIGAMQVYQERIERMREFEIDAMSCGAINQSDTHRYYNDETKWTVPHVNTLFELWLAGVNRGMQYDKESSTQASRSV